MDDVLKNKWMTRLFFIGTTVFFAGFVLYIIANPNTPGYMLGSQQPPPVVRENVSFAPGDEITLVVDKVTVIGKSRYRYQGRAGSKVLFQVVIPDLDPEYGYIHRVAIADAKKGFRLADRTFRLLAATKQKARLVLQP